MFIVKLILITRIEDHSSEHSGKAVGTHERSNLNSAIKVRDDKHIENTEVDSNEKMIPLPTTRATATAAGAAAIRAAVAAAAAARVTSIKSQKTATSGFSDLIDRTLTFHTTHRIKIVKILTFEINVPKEGSQWSRYRKNVAMNKIINNHKNSDDNKNKANQDVKSESIKSVECVQTRERTWGISTINFIATVDQNGKISDGLKFNDSVIRNAFFFFYFPSISRL